MKVQATVRRTMIVSMSMIVNLEVESRKKACLTNTNPDTLAQVNSGTERGRECAGERELDRWRSVQMEGEREVWRSQGWIVFLFLVNVHFPKKFRSNRFGVDDLSPTALSISTHRSGSSIRPALIHQGWISWSNPEHLV